MFAVYLFIHLFVYWVDCVHFLFVLFFHVCEALAEGPMSETVVNFYVILLNCWNKKFFLFFVS